MRIRRVFLALVLALGAGGCGDDGDDGAGDEAPSTTTTGDPSASAAGDTSSSTVAAATDDAALVGRIVLQASDLPAGWTSTPIEAPDEALERESAECLGVAFDPGRPEAISPQFSNGPVTRLFAATQLAPTAEVAAAEFAALRTPRANECVKTLFTRSAGQAGGPAALNPVQVEGGVAPKAGDEAHAVRLVTGVQAPDGSTVPIYADAVFVRKGRATITLTFVNALQPFDQALATDLVRKLVSRA